MDDVLCYKQFKKALTKKIAPANWRKIKETQHFAIIVPYRDNPFQDRHKQLGTFVPFMTKYLKPLIPVCEFSLIVVEQSQDGEKFNRGKLLNIGFEIARERGCQYHIFHDVDLLPSPLLLGYYAHYPKVPLHIAAVWEKYQNLGLFFGGVCSFNTQQFEQLDGYPNEFWGWGGEDEVLYHRITDYGLPILIPQSGSFSEMEHIASKIIPGFENTRRFEQIAKREPGKGKDGLSTLSVKNIFSPEKLNRYTYKYMVEL